MVELVPIRAIDAAWTDLEDWELLLALHRHERNWDGMITNDEDMLSLAKEMTVLSQTALTLVVAKGEGHNPIRAVGALLCHVPFICHHTTRDRAQVWNLRVSQKNYDAVQVYLEKIAAKDGITVSGLVANNRVPATQELGGGRCGHSRRIRDTGGPVPEWRPCPHSCCQPLSDEMVTTGMTPSPGPQAVSRSVCCQPVVSPDGLARPQTDRAGPSERTKTPLMTTISVASPHDRLVFRKWPSQVQSSSLTQLN